MSTKALITVIAFLFIGCNDGRHTIKIKGSDTEVNLSVLLAEEFHRTNQDLTLSISGGGSGLGIASLLNGQADIASSSRGLNSFEDSLFRERKISIESFVFAEDAIAFVVSASSKIDSITADELSKLLDGSYRTWQPITGEAIPVNIYGRQSNSGTHSFIKNRLKIEFSDYSKEMNGNAQIIEAIKTDRSGIGYVGAGYIKAGGANQGVKVLKISGAKNEPAVSPLDEEAIKNMQYYFQRPLFQFIRKTSMEKVAPFINFEKSESGLSIIKASGYYEVPK